MARYDVGDSLLERAEAVASKPRWVNWFSSFNLLRGFAALPSGHRRLVYVDTDNVRVKSDCYVIPKTQSSTDAQWRAVIYASNGSYIKATGLGDTPTIGTPVVRIGVNAPSKAVVRFPVLKGTPGNILASTFRGWSDGHAEAVSRGMEITVEYRDASTNAMRMAFRGMIYQIESGDVVTVTAYDRLMDLAQYSDQYQSHAGYMQNDTSKSRAVSGDNYVYQMNNNVGALLTANTINLLKIDATPALTYSSSHTASKWYAIPLPRINGVGLETGSEITKINIRAYCYFTARRFATSAPYAGMFSFYAELYLYRMINGTLTRVATTSSGIYWDSAATSINLREVTVENKIDDLTIEKGTPDWGSNEWIIEGDPSEYYLAVVVNYRAATTFGWEMLSHKEYAQYTSSKPTFTGQFYTSDDGNTWTAVDNGDHPEIGIEFTHTGSSVATSSFTISGTALTVAQASIPDVPSDGYLTTVGKGIRLIVSYFISDAAGIQGIIYDLLEWAGLVPDVVSENMGTTDYYTSSTYDYMTCIIELLRNGNYGLKARIDKPGEVIVRRRHTVSETPDRIFTTDPSVTGEHIILAHDLTAHWMAEKATQAYIAEDATASGLPVALETDDALMDNSLVEIMGAPMRSVIADNSLGTHNLQAYAAGGKMVQLHTNVFEGKMTLAGYRLDIWDLTLGAVGGLPIGIDIPEYGAQGTAIPTEIIIGDGVTQVSLDNVRTADRSEIANSMGLSADAISNNASAVPESVFIFARINRNSALPEPTVGQVTVKLYDEDGVVATQSTASYIKIVEDGAGYRHIAAIFPATDQPSGYAPSKPIDRVSVTLGTFGEYVAPLDNPKYAYDGQNVHVDIRFNYVV